MFNDIVHRSCSWLRQDDSDWRFVDIIYKILLYNQCGETWSLFLFKLGWKNNMVKIFSNSHKKNINRFKAAFFLTSPLSISRHSFAREACSLHLHFINNKCSYIYLLTSVKAWSTRSNDSKSNLNEAPARHRKFPPSYIFERQPSLFLG